MSVRPRNRIGQMLVSSRSLAEYRAMFALTGKDLTGMVLDCPGGAASFTAEVNAFGGGKAIACDPLYSLDLAEIREVADDGLRRAFRYHTGNPEEYVWTFFTGPDHYLESRSASIELFAAHRLADPECYVPAGLPTLPFTDGTFDLALCSHLLFSYADRFDRRFHRASLRELARVAREVRVFPLVPMGMATNPELDLVRAGLAEVGLATTVVRVDYEFQRGGNEMLVVTQDRNLANP